MPTHHASTSTGHRRLPRLLERRDADIICLNATTDPATCRTEAIRGFLESYFPPLG